MSTLYFYACVCVMHARPQGVVRDNLGRTRVNVCVCVFVCVCADEWGGRELAALGVNKFLGSKLKLCVVEIVTVKNHCYCYYYCYSDF